MIKYLSLLSVIFLMGNFDACQDQSEKCEKTKAPEINFKFLIGAHNYYYDMLKKDDGGSAYFEIDIHTQWDKADKKIKNTAISDK